MSPRGTIEGGTHSVAHAVHRILLRDGTKLFTQSEVDKVIIENGRAKGIQLLDGTEIEARELIVSNVDPYSLCFRLIGEEYLSPQILRKVRYLSREHTCMAYYTWALHEPPKYKLARHNPGVNRASCTTFLVTKDPEALIREDGWRKIGKIAEELCLMTICYGHEDKKRVPDGKFTALTEQFVLPANRLTEREWMEFKPYHADRVIRFWSEFAPNMTWDNVIGYIPLTPYDHCRLANMAPQGNWAVIDHIPSQMGRFRPIPELARHKTPIEGLYATGAAWHPGGGGFAAQGYNCYKIIADDFGLRKPWEEKGRPY